MNKTEYGNPNYFILKDLKVNAPINNNAKDSYLRETYKNEITENTLSYNLNVAPLLYRDRNNLHFKNKVLDECICNPQYDYESNGGRSKQYFATEPIRTNVNYQTPPLQRTSSRY